MNREPQLQQEIEKYKRYEKTSIRIFWIVFSIGITLFTASLVYHLTTTEPEPAPPRTPPITPMQEHYNALDTFQYSDDSKGTSRFDWDARKRGILINN